MSELETLTEANTKLTEEINNNIVEHKETGLILYACDKDLEKAGFLLGI